MVKIKYNGESYEMKNQLEELTIGEFEKISNLLNNNTLKVEAYMDVFHILGVPQNIIDELDYDEFVSIINSFEFTAPELGYRQSFELDGYTYVSYTGDEFKLKVKDMSLCEKYVMQNPEAYIGEIMAILFKREDLTKNEHYENIHIKHKAKLFREHMRADIAVPFIGLFSEKLIKNVVILKDEIENDEINA
jgi:hypothetical protein